MQIRSEVFVLTDRQTDRQRRLSWLADIINQMIVICVQLELVRRVIINDVAAAVHGSASVIDHVVFGD